MIRKASAEDVHSLAEIFRQLHEHHVKIAPDSHRMPFPQYFELELRSILENEDMQVILCERDGAVAGYAVFNIFERDRAERTFARILYIEQFAVHSDMRHKGCGTELFEHLKQLAREEKCDCIQLGAAAQNHSALSFYEKQGMLPRTIRLELKLT